MAQSESSTTVRTVQAALLAWVLPGAGHHYLGHRGLALVFFVAISVPYFAGLAIGGVTNCVNARSNPWLLLAELGVGGYTAPGALVSRVIERRVLQQLGYERAPDPRDARDAARCERFARQLSPYVSYYPESDVAQIYLATAGLLNVLAILDAIARAQTGGLPTFEREGDTSQPAEAGP